MKSCTKCKAQKAFLDFHKDKSRVDGYRDCCKKCVSTYMAKIYANDPQKVKAKVVLWIEKNREKHNAKCRKWAKVNPGMVNARTARRYATKTCATPKWLNKDQLWMISEAYALATLRTKMLGFAWEVDHIVPLRGKKVMGLHVPWNLQVVPMRENRRKSNSYEVA